MLTPGSQAQNRTVDTRLIAEQRGGNGLGTKCLGSFVDSANTPGAPTVTGDTPSQGPANDGPRARSSWPPVFVNNSRLEPTAPMGLHIIEGCSCTIGAELPSCNRGHMALRAGNIYYLALCQPPF